LGVRGGQLLPFGHQPVDARTALQQRHQGLLHLHHQRAAPLTDQRGVADHLERVPQPLLGVQQDGALGQRRAVPQRRGQSLHAMVFTQPPPLELRPAPLEIPHAQPTDRPIQMRHRQVVVDLGEIGLDPHRHGQVVMPFGIVGLQPDRLAMLRDCFQEPALIA